MSSGDLGCAVPVKVLIVEDSRTQAEILKHTLEKHGYIPTLAENGREALEIIGTINPDVIISDVIMPVMDGYEFCRTIKNDTRYKHIPVILLTMLTDSKDIMYAMVSGADNFITKPYQSEYLVSRLKKILSQKNIPHPADSYEPPIEVILSGKKFTISHNRPQIIDLLTSAYEAAVIQHNEVLITQHSLAEANNEANLYLDIITHDINNVNTGALALTELLLLKTGESEKPLAMRLISCINQSIEIIGNVSTIRRLLERREALKPILLDDVIRHECLRFPTSKMNYSKTPVSVSADSLLGQVFLNLISNSIKFAGTKAVIDISVTDQGEMIEVVIADNGPGIPDEAKPLIFDRFKRGKTTKTGKGLGLFIARALVEGYGGRIWAVDKVQGKPEAGASMHFTLKKA
ncbi:MAG: response regulator [Methanoregula sp.]|nr:response regulator [Methanoregula sp.]